MITLPSLPYAYDALEPVIDTQTVEIHYGKHHQWYVNKLNELIAGTPFEHASLEDIIRQSEGSIFNNAAQVRNHTFYREWLQSPQSSNMPSWPLYDALIASRWSMEQFQQAMVNAGIQNFGSWRTRLVKQADSSLAIINTSNAWCPLTTNQYPLLTIDVREHAYYLKYQNRRAEYLERIWECINRHVVAQRFHS